MNRDGVAELPLGEIDEGHPKFTECELLDALRVRHTYTGNGGAGRYAFLTHVRTGAAWDQQEIDAIVLDLWPSGHHDLHAFEVKCSRSDWLREIRPDTSKSETTRALADTFTIVAPDGIVRPGELPTTWGLLEAWKDRGVVRIGGRGRVRQPARQRPLGPAYNRTLPRGLVVAMMRAADVVPGMTSGLKRGKKLDGRTWDEHPSELVTS